MKNKFTIGVLLHGDYPQLAERCLQSLADTIKAVDFNIRVGLNAVSPEVTEWVKSWIPKDRIWEYPTNIHKYPLLRDMVHGVRHIDTDYFMWFDDDSFLEGFELTSKPSRNESKPGKQPYWLALVDQAMVNADLLGAIYHMPFFKNQREWVKAQSWYTGKDPANRNMKFATGGWWTIRTELLYRYNYPWPELDHNGGDALLGELCLQQDLRLRNFRTGVKINADAQGRESKAARRGFRQPPLGHDYDPGVAATLNRATTPPLRKIEL